MGEDLARLLLLALLGAFFVNLTRGTATRWLRAKFLGKGPAPAAAQAGAGPARSAPGAPGPHV